jgi:hypothetical protein
MWPSRRADVNNRDKHDPIEEILESMAQTIREISALVADVVYTWRRQQEHLGLPKDTSIELITSLLALQEWWDQHHAEESAGLS